MEKKKFLLNAPNMQMLSSQDYDIQGKLSSHFKSCVCAGYKFYLEANSFIQVRMYVCVCVWVCVLFFF